MTIKRKKRKTLSKENPSLEEPMIFNIEDLGSDKDPCFGKGHDPADSICNSCGDSEFCQMAKAQLNSLKRTKVEKTTKFKDLNPPEKEGLTTADLRKFIKAKAKKGYSSVKILRLCTKKFTPHLSQFSVIVEVENHFLKTE